MLDRKCVCCRKIKKQNEMLRITRVNGLYLVDEKNKLGGRGAYICKDKQCLQTTIKKHLLNKAYKTNVGAEIYQKLEEYEKNN